MKTIVQNSLLVVLLFSLAACSTPLDTDPTPASTATHPQTNTPLPTPTPTAAPTRTATATQRPALVLGERHVLAAAGFSVQVPIGYASQLDAQQIFMSDLEGTVIISFTGIQSTSSEEEIVDEYLAAVASRGDGELEKTPADPVTIDGIEGQAFDISGSLSGVPVQGKTFILLVDPDRYLYGLAMSRLPEEGPGWEEHGTEAFEAVIESIEFVEPQESETCPIATDDTYGYTKENPIRIGDGGEFFGGPARERAYLDNLRGPNGEPLSYERTGSLNFEDTILDEYILRGLPAPVTLYLDIYSFEEPMAPVGFTCAGPFNLEP